MPTMRPLLLHVAVLAAILGLSPTAAALVSQDHRTITASECRDAGLPPQFCRRAGAESYNVDTLESDDLEAHAQVGEDQSVCDAADLTTLRMQQLGADFRSNALDLAGSTWSDRAEAVPTALGRALHTIQDNCAHQGMTNPEHAWTSRSDYCDGTALSPDIQPEALECARVETRAVLDAIAPLIEDLEIARLLDERSCPVPRPADEGGDPNAEEPCFITHDMGAGTVCRFLRTARHWDGVDRRWDHRVVAPMLFTAFIDAVYGLEPTETLVCDQGSLEVASPAPTVDVSSGPAECGTIDVLCLGRADTGAELDGTSQAPTAAAGCSSAPGASGTTAVWLLLPVVVLLWPPRARS